MGGHGERTITSSRKQKEAPAMGSKTWEVNSGWFQKGAIDERMFLCGVQDQKMLQDCILPTIK